MLFKLRLQESPMEQEHHIAFGPFRVDKTHGRLWRGADVIALRPRSLALLRYLLAHPGRLVTQALHEVFAFGHSKKHMIQPHLGRLEPTPFLKYRAAEVMRNMPVLST